MTSIVIGTSTHGDCSRQDVAIDSLHHLSEIFQCVEVVDLQLQGEPSQQHYDISSLTCMFRHSGMTVDNSNKKLPYVNDAINVLSTFDCDYFIYVNSDVIVNSNLIRYIVNHDPGSFACSRLDIEEPVNGFSDVLNKNIKPIRYEIAGFDVFVFKKSWFVDHSEMFQDYLVGQPHWDQVYATIIKIFGGNVPFGNNYPPFCFHIKHGMTWQKTMSPERMFNQTCSKRPLDQLAMQIFNDYLNTILTNRQPYGSFMQPLDNEREIEGEFFSKYI